MPNEVITEAQWLTSVSGIEGYWTLLTGGQVRVSHRKVYDGGSLDPEITQGRPNVEDVTVSRPYLLPRDDDLATNLRRQLARGARLRFTVTRVPTDSSLIPIGKKQIWECVLRDVNTPDSNAASENESRIELVFTAKKVQ